MGNLEAGRYTGRAKPETLAFAPAKGGGDHASMAFELLNEGVQGRTVTWFGALVGGAIPITLRELRDTGWSADSIFDTAGIGTVEVTLDIRYETWEGKERMKVAVYGDSAGYVPKNPIVGAALGALDAKLRGAILQSKKGGAAATTKAPAAWKPTPAAPPAQEWDGQGVNPHGSDEDLPY